MPELKIVRVQLVEDRTLYSQARIRTPEDAVDIMRKEISLYDREIFCILNLNIRNQIINMNIASVGAIDNTITEPREIFKASILSNAKSVLLMHNHPSGDPTPSNDDYMVTYRLARCGVLLGIKVLDHLVIGNSGTYYSMLEHEEMPPLNEREIIIGNNYRKAGHKKHNLRL